MPFIDYPKDDEEASVRARQHEFSDPLASIPRALLSSAEVDDYVRITGLLHPFYSKNLKSASYEAHIGGDVIWWDEKGRKHRRAVTAGEQLTLPASSIVFVQVEPVFRLPYYIAIRFNLRITHVHRGLLLGTGPLVDPGFCGKLLIPLHNLTSSDYDLDTSKALIWIEFTKTSYGTLPVEDVSNKNRMNVVSRAESWL
jgi:deoxycytidine triphosphate deaminase